MRLCLLIAGLMFAAAALADTQVRVQVTTRPQQYYTCTTPDEYVVCPSAGMWRYTLLDATGQQYKFIFSAADVHGVTFTLPAGKYTAIVDRLTADGKQMDRSAVLCITVIAGTVTPGCR